MNRRPTDSAVLTATFVRETLDAAAFLALCVVIIAACSFGAGRL